MEENPEAEIFLLSLKLKKIPNSKTSGHDGIQSSWFSKYPSIHHRFARRSKKFPEWIKKGKPTLIQKDPHPKKATIQNNYKPITYLLIMWMNLTAQIQEGIFSLESCVLYPEERKGYRKGYGGILNNYTEYGWYLRTHILDWYYFLFLLFYGFYFSEINWQTLC